jgi:hypothetical protein
MTFDLMRAGWPNMVAIAALAVLPLVSLMLPAPQAHHAEPAIVLAQAEAAAE